MTRLLEALASVTFGCDTPKIEYYCISPSAHLFDGIIAGRDLLTGRYMRKLGLTTFHAVAVASLALPLTTVVDVHPLKLVMA